MATRQEERERLRQHREEAEHEATTATRRRLVAGYFVAGLLSLAVVVGIVAVVLSGDGGGGSAAEGAFGTHWGGLQERRAEAGVPTMAEGGGSHFHPGIAVFVDGEQVTVPANIGVDPALSPTEMAGLHTHDTSGTIHNEAGENSTLSQVFAIWGVPFSQEQLGPHNAKGSKEVRMWVDGKPSQAFGRLKLEDGQQIVVSYDDKDAPPPPLG